MLTRPGSSPGPSWVKRLDAALAVRPGLVASGQEAPGIVAVGGVRAASGRQRARLFG